MSEMYSLFLLLGNIVNVYISIECFIIHSHNAYVSFDVLYLLYIDTSIYTLWLLLAWQRVLFFLPSVWYNLCYNRLAKLIHNSYQRP